MKLIVLAGGGGTRLFPLSRGAYPKQFLRIFSEETLLQQTVRRFLPLVEAKDIVVVTNKDYLFHVQANLREIGAAEAAILCEPVGRNTAPAIALAVAYCREVLGAADNECIVVTPADHLIAPPDLFTARVQAAVAEAEGSRSVVTLGVEPDKPETGFGYIEAGEALPGGALRVRRFTEKPDAATAAGYLAQGGYFWNAGMFVFTAGTFTDEMMKAAPDIAAFLARGYEAMLAEFGELPEISIDYALAEKCDRLAVVPMTGIVWNDIGSFDAISEVFADREGNAFSGDVIAEDCRNTLVMGETRLVSAIGLDDVLIADTPDVLLVAKKGHSQEVKEVVAKLKERKRPEVTFGTTVYRPWGCYTTLAEGEGYKVKRITVNPGEKLSLQMHYHRSEHWTVIKGTGKLTVGDKEIIFRENESTYIPIGAKHRLENPGKLPLSIIEVQNGKYLGEDDIVRFDDIYGR